MYSECTSDQPFRAAAICSSGRARPKRRPLLERGVDIHLLVQAATGLWSCAGRSSREGGVMLRLFNSGIHVGSCCIVQSLSLP
jgi:hypothetical protein